MRRTRIPFGLYFYFQKQTGKEDISTNTPFYDMIMVNYYKTIEQKGVFSMEDTSKNKKDKLNEKPLKHVSIGLLAHVDAGKTTLSESLLYASGRIRTLGRVDHKDAFLDTYELEKQRGITIFSKQAVFETTDYEVTLLDTPGHVDFSAETERTLQVLDYAVLVINGADGVQGHTQTLWRLLKRHEIPVFLFINKMDQQGCDREALLCRLQKKLDEHCMDFGAQEDVFYESIAMSEEDALNHYLENGIIETEEIQTLIAKRKVFPCYFGSALKLEGVESFLEGLNTYMKSKEYGEDFGARVYKIGRDAKGERLTYLKVTGGKLNVKEVLTQSEEKVNQIRIYSGEKFETVPCAVSGSVCAVTGLTDTYAGQGLGFEKEAKHPILEPVLSYQIQLPEGCDVHKMLLNLKLLEEEDPQLHIVWEEALQEIHVKLMGEVQIEILQSIIKERFGVEVTFGTGNIVYKETIAAPIEGAGHFEPLRHYAEVHLLLEPLEAGSGLVFDTLCSEDMLSGNWQRLILTHLAEREHPGVLTGAPITDMKITLLAGKSHLKHTEGGDFRQATYRAVRQGLKKANSVLLEPYYEFRLEIPPEYVGRAMTDIQKMCGNFETPFTEEEISVLTGSAPVSEMRAYQMEVITYTKGKGKLFCSLKGYAPCHNQEEVVSSIGYDSEGDIDNPTGSVFCSHGAGYYVPWNEADSHMHIQIKNSGKSSEEKTVKKQAKEILSSVGKTSIEEKELEEIFMRTYGKIERKSGYSKRNVGSDDETYTRKKKEYEREYLLVDGYNIIFAWDELKELTDIDIGAARLKLMDILSNYQGYKKCTLILVFDAYKVEGNMIEIQKYHNIHVVYTKEAETADQYIEKVVHEIGRRYRVRVATSDNLEQVITVGQGASLVSAREFYIEMEEARAEIKEEIRERRQSAKNYLFDHLDEALAKKMEQVRLGEKDLN